MAGQVTTAAQAPLAGRVIAITGATGGMGRAIALAAARDGAQLVLIARNVLKLQGLRAEIEQFAPGQALMAPLDLETALANDYDNLAAAVLARYGRLDGLVHCAGLLGSVTPIDQYDVPMWCRVMHVNVTAAFALTQVLLPAPSSSPAVAWAAGAGLIGAPMPYPSLPWKDWCRCWQQNCRGIRTCASTR